MAKKTLPPLREVVDPYIDALWKLHDDRRCDAGSKKHLHTLIRDLMGISHMVDTLLEGCNVQPHRRMGRHAQLPQREDQLYLDFQCWRLCHKMHDAPSGMSWDEAYVAVGREVSLGPDAVKIRRFKVERMLKEQSSKASRTWIEKI